MIENHRTILRADIVALAIPGRWIVDGEEDLEDFAKVGDCGIESDLDDFDMARSSAADFFVRRIRILSSHVARFNGLHAFHLVIDRFEAPEASTAECRGFHISVSLIL
jgi:hypothetical protein